MSDLPAPGVKARRFIVQRHLGAGGFGDVYEAFDQQRQDLVALKVLRHSDATALYRFKQEFRTLANLTHPNLVTLHELIASDEEWLLSMELIRGGTFIEHVRPSSLSNPVGTAGIAVPDAPTISSPRSGEAPAILDRSRLPLPIETLDIDRLRRALRQLVEGVQVLHANGILHLDLKPSNVLVTDEGRVVVVDFGLAEQFDRGDRRPEGTQVIGTPEYMSPEQAAAHSPTEASDWYCVGAMLYRALTGLMTFAGDASSVMRQKRECEPAPPSQLVAGVPPDLDSLCCDLLRREPARRPDGAVILERVGASVSPHARPSIAARVSTTFVGRASHLAELDAAFNAMAAGQPAAVHVLGRSGMGKTALVRRFLDGIRHRAVVLEGRCYEHEAVPFKAFDGLLDALTNHLRSLRAEEVPPLLPRGVELLARVFPALQRVPAIAAAQERSRIVDPTELRRRAFAALREFFARVAERVPLVIVIDDLQWGDHDSAMLLDELLRPPQPPPLLLIAAYRSDELETSPCLRALLTAEGARSEAGSARRLEVAELADHEAQALASLLLPGGEDRARAARIAGDSRGHPLFIDQLARHADAAGADQDTLESVLWSRLMLLPARSRQLMEAVAIAGQPIDLAIAATAAEVESGAFELFASLRAARLIRSRSKHGVTEAEPYHDRIREMIVARLPDQVRAGHHRRLALALEQSATTDLEALTHHFRAGGDTLKAAHWAVEAAERSVNALAFAGAARLYRLAIDLQPEGADVTRLYVKLGGALSMTGRVNDAADAFLAAARLAPPIERVELQRRAGEEYLQGFQLEKALALLRSTLAEMGMQVASSTTTAFVALLLRRLYFRIRGTAFRERAAADIPVAELQQLDLCSTLCRGLGFTDTLRAVELQTRHLALALTVGEPFRIARALTLSAAADGLAERRRERAYRYLEQARELSERVQNPFGIGIVHSARGIVALGAGRFLEARQEFETADHILRHRCVAPPFTTLLCHVYRLEAVYCAGQLREYFQMIPEFAAEVQERGDLHAEVNVHLRQCHMRCFVEDDLERAEEELNKARARLGHHKLLVTRNNFVFRQIEFALYAGQPERAWALMPVLSRVLVPMRLFGFEFSTTICFEKDAYAALAMAASAIERHQPADKFLRRAERDARHIDAWRAPFGRPIAELIRGVVALQRGSNTAARHFEAAEDGFKANDMALHAVVAKWRLGRAAGGHGGARLIEEARSWMVEQGVRNPERLNGMIAPA